MRGLVVKAALAGAGLAATWWCLTPPSFEAPAGPAPVVTVRPIVGGGGEPTGEALFVADAAAEVVPGSASGPPQLLGIVGRLSDPLAMVRDADDKVRTIAPGQAVGGWTLVDVAPDRVRFRRGREDRVAVLPPREEAGAE